MLESLFVFALQAAVAQGPAPEPMRCATAAVVAAPATATPGDVTAHFMYFAMEATKLDQQGKPFLTRLNEVAGSAQKLPVLERAAAAQVIAACDQRYPLARRGGEAWACCRCSRVLPRPWRRTGTTAS
jgi:hypothetical protein